ncbi:hypothetical protein [Actinomadura rubrisoli]|uniref:Uncharacterized protein n=1 Tax=Actinomadura rubrisoli TaxID=2530368 RepID=A0A4V2YWM2_9ACTN|nr:hypothetical protein [Actinomadura rubrisoli]TDD85927.1 hypothetical protein E1298_18060 [Actinomadura rubrisoli]
MSRSVAALLHALAAVHSERLEALKAVRAYFSVLGAKDVACALAEAGGYPVLAVSRVDGIGGTLTLGCTYDRRHGQWWITTPGANGQTGWLALAQDPRGAAELAIMEMRRRRA